MFFKKKKRVGNMSQWSRVFIVIAKNLDLFPSRAPVPGGSDTLC